MLMASNRGYRYGDGLFETMKVIDGTIQLAAYHFERLFASLSILKFEIPSLFKVEKIEKEILSLCKKNQCEKLGRVRLSVSRGNGGLYDEDKNLQYLIECWPLNASFNKMNENGLIIDIYPDAIKSCDTFSNIKSANFLPYSMAALFAKEHKLNDCLLQNSEGMIADSTIANIFIIKDDIIFTPALDQACVQGVMRRHLIKMLKHAKYKLQENAITIEMLRNADEIFLTNAIKGISWVKQFRDATYGNLVTVEIYNKFVKTIPI